MNKMFKILEIIWLVMGFVGVIMSIYFIITKDKQGVIYFIIFTLICGVMYAVRKRQRIKFELAQKQKDPN
ncbi:MAG: hypothetical protein ABI315_10895 [Bacteroidia bacterium]